MYLRCLFVKFQNIKVNVFRFLDFNIYIKSNIDLNDELNFIWLVMGKVEFLIEMYLNIILNIILSFVFICYVKF